MCGNRACGRVLCPVAHAFSAVIKCRHCMIYTAITLDFELACYNLKLMWGDLMIILYPCCENGIRPMFVYSHEYHTRPYDLVRYSCLLAVIFLFTICTTWITNINLSITNIVLPLLNESIYKYLPGKHGIGCFLSAAVSFFFSYW